MGWCGVHDYLYILYIYIYIYIYLYLYILIDFWFHKEGVIHIQKSIKTWAIRLGEVASRDGVWILYLEVGLSSHLQNSPVRSPHMDDDVDMTQ